MGQPYLLLAAAALILAAFVLGTAAFLVWFERKLLGRMQVRPGPNRVGPGGLLQPVADILKLTVKEDILPEHADRPLFRLAPLMAFVPAFAAFVVLPFGPGLVSADLNIGLLWILAVSTVSVLALIAAGWASNSKYALLGGMRAAAQMISYEVPLVLSLIGVVLAAGSLRLGRIVAAQAHLWFAVPQVLGFIVYLIAATAESNRSPFDLPEGESELVAGFHTEYSGVRFAFFFLAEYSYVFLAAAIATLAFLGGWSGPFLPPVVWFLVKTYAVIFFIIWLRATLPRIRIDQLLSFGWKVLLPLSLVNIFLVGLFRFI